jgi:hypothetical protein
MTVIPEYVQNGDELFFDVGHGIESGYVHSVQVGTVKLSVPFDGTRTLDISDVYTTRLGAMAAEEGAFIE